MTDYPAFTDAVLYLTRRKVALPRGMIAVGVKTYAFFLSTIRRLVNDVYRGDIGGDFINIMGDLIAGQFRKAWEEGMRANGLDPKTDMLPEWELELQGLIADQFPFVEQFYRDIVDARVDETPVEPLLSRADIWGNQYNSVVNQAKIVTAAVGQKLMWVLGATEEHCSECNALNGIVAFASEWETLDVHPQSPPNSKISCGGWRCACTLTPTTRRRSPKAFDTILNIVSGV